MVVHYVGLRPIILKTYCVVCGIILDESAKGRNAQVRLELELSLNPDQMLPFDFSFLGICHAHVHVRRKQAAQEQYWLAGAR